MLGVAIQQVFHTPEAELMNYRNTALEAASE
jgi:hypothetical protein